jgi:Tfp pilus assembly protein PilV
MSLAQYQFVPTTQVSTISFRSKRLQSGVVLFIALIALVVMSLAAVALIRSVDTNSLIAGNLSYKQTAAISSSYGIESMADTLGVKPLNYGDATDAVNGYYARCTTFDTSPTRPCNGEGLTADASWTSGVSSRTADGVGIVAGVDAYGNAIQYIVERMCSQVGAISKSSCLLSPVDLDNRSHNTPPKAGPMVLTDIPLYRVTVRVTGPKNTVSYVQAFIS